MSEPDRVSKSPARKRGRVIILLVCLLIVSLAACGYLFWKYKNTSDNTPQAKQQRLVNELGKVAISPHEEPVITTIANASKLNNKTLAREAHNGDVLFIFSKSQRIILYRPGDHKVVDMLNIQPRR